MGRVTVEATLANMEDVFRADRGEIPRDAIRQITIENALVHTAATGLAAPGSIINRLGLRHRHHRQAMTANGLRDFDVYGTVRLTIQDRDCPMDVTELPEDCPVMIGQLPLGSMDFVVDPARQRLIGNPDHNGEWVLEIF